MDEEILQLVEHYDSGHITRRQLVAWLGSLAALMSASGMASPAGTEGSTFEAVGLNHIALRVKDVARSRDFYVKHLGLKVATDNGPRSCFLDCGENFVALFKGEKPQMDHYCYSIKDYDVAETEKTLEAEGLKPERQGNRIYFPDPDGLTVQLASPK